MDLKRRCITDPTELDALQKDWDALLLGSSTASPFCSHAWCVSWWKIFGKGWRPEVYTWQDGGRLVALLPLMRRRQLGVLQEVRFMNGPPVAPERLDVLVLAGLEPEVRPALISLHRELRLGCDLARYADLAPDGLLASSLWDGTEPDDAHAFTMPSPSQAGVKIEGTFDAYFADRGPKVRRNYRHARRALQAELTALPSSVLPNSPEQALACFDALWKLHGKSFRRRREFDYFGAGSVEGFHRAVLASPGTLSLVRFVTLKSSSRVFASAYCLVHRRRMFCYQIGFDPEVEKLSPGFVTIGAAIELAFDEGCAYFDFLRGDEPYKHRWANASHHTISYTQSMDTIAAGIWYGAVGISGGLRKVKRALRRIAS